VRNTLLFIPVDRIEEAFKVVFYPREAHDDAALNAGV